MEYVLFIEEKDLVRFTIVDGNVDRDKFVQFIKIAEDKHVQNYLGTKLFKKLKEDIKKQKLDADYRYLLDTFIKPMTIHWAMVEYLPFAAYTLANKGIYKHQSENSESVSKSEVDFLIEKQRDTAQHYSKRFVDYMCFNAPSRFREYYTNVNDDIRPDDESFFGGWVL